MQSSMNRERIALTCAPGGENHRDNQFIGVMPVKGEGLTASDMAGLCAYNLRHFHRSTSTVELLNLNNLSDVSKINDLDVVDQARVLILRKWVQSNMGEGATESIYKNIGSDAWDAKYLDPNKYRIEMVDGKETRIRGKVLNKLARTNLCYVAGTSQEPSYLEGKGRIVDLDTKTLLTQSVDKLKGQIADGLISIGSKTKVVVNVVEGNRYYDLKNTGIGFHGDTERVIVICISIGCDNYPMRWQWFNESMPVGTPIDIVLNDGDVYIMGEKAVGADWRAKGSHKSFTLRHAAGCEKYRSLAKWEKRRPAYDAKKKARVEKATAKILKQQLRVDAKDAKNKARVEKAATNNPKLRQILKLEEDLKLPDDCPEYQQYEQDEQDEQYKFAIKSLDWEDSDVSFYKWIAVEAEYGPTPKKEKFKIFQATWNGLPCILNNEEWDAKRMLYRSLCGYKTLLMNQHD